MIGDKMLIYDLPNGRFLAGWKRRWSEPKWSDTSKGALVVHRLSDAYAYKERLGMGIRIISETEAKRIDAIKEYKEAEQCRK